MLWQNSQDNSPGYDLFISHASEDKESVARSLAGSLTARGLAVWFDDKDLRIGESKASNINERITASRAAVTILSRAYFKQKWKRHELDTLVYLTMSSGRKICPVWHNIVADELGPHTLFFSTYAGLDTGDHRIEAIADEIYRSVLHDVA